MLIRWKVGISYSSVTEVVKKRLKWAEFTQSRTYEIEENMDETWVFQSLLSIIIALIFDKDFFTKFLSPKTNIFERTEFS